MSTVGVDVEVYYFYSNLYIFCSCIRNYTLYILDIILTSSLLSHLLFPPLVTSPDP